MCVYRPAHREVGSCREEATVACLWMTRMIISPIKKIMAIALITNVRVWCVVAQQFGGLTEWRGTGAYHRGPLD